MWWKNVCKFSTNKSEQKIILELLSEPQFELLPQDSYANYEIQSLPLTLAKGKLYAALVEAITPHSTLRFNPYCRRIFSMIHLKQVCDDDMYYEC
ncbi:unnamed protein product [Musa acuminata subsp. burmannicoides]